MNGEVGGVQARSATPSGRGGTDSAGFGRRLARALAGLILAAFPASLAHAADPTLRVTVSLVGVDGASSPAPDAVVWVAEAPSTPASRALVEGPAIASRQKAFAPRVVVVPVGGTVHFPNDDPIFHNVFSSSEVASFDLGLYRNGEAKSQVFARPGVVPIYCNIHPRMLAHVVVVPSRLYGLTAPDGAVELTPAPAGSRMVEVWHEKGGRSSAMVEVATAGVTSLALTLDASSWRETRHLNKYGKPYPPPDDDETRY